MRIRPGNQLLVDTASGTYECEIILAFPIGDETVYDVRITDPTHPGSNILGAVRADRLHPLPIAPVCDHGEHATLVTVVDRSLKTQLDPYGDIHGPARLGNHDVMRYQRDIAEEDAGAEPGRFVLAFIHPDGCRTEQYDRQRGL